MSANGVELTNRNFNTSYVVIKHVAGAKDMASWSISIHLMLLLNGLVVERKGKNSTHFNTSYVVIKHGPRKSNK